VDYWKWAEREDVVSHDLYPDPAEPEAHVGAAMTYDLMRSLGGGRPWVLMEQTTVRVNWRERNVPKKPGRMRLWSHGAVAHGADGIMFFQWRASRAGAEKFHSAMVPHVRPEDSRSWNEVRQLGGELANLDRLLGARGEAETAILLDWENWWALELDSKPSAAVRMLDGLYSFYKPLFETNVPVDFANPGADLSRYKIIIAPNLYLVSDEDTENITRFVAGGGTLLMSFFSGIVDENEHIRLGGYPAPFREMLGLRVEDFVPFAAEEENGILSQDGAQYSCDLWADLVHLEGAEALASYQGGFYAGTPAVTRHGFGDGVAYYLGTRPEEPYTKLLLERACREVRVEPPLEVPLGVEVVRRRTGEASFLFALNHGAHSAEVRLDGPVRDLLTGSEHEVLLTLEPLGVAVLEEIG
jgi:beta-galactosidase